jgi:hypothetical protein
MRLVLILALGWAVLALPASADYHDDDGYDGDEGYEDTFDDEYDDGAYDDPLFDAPQAEVVQDYDCDQSGREQCAPAPGQGIRK